MTKSSSKSSESSSCSCMSDDADVVDFSNAEENLQEVIAELQEIHIGLHSDMVKICPDPVTNACKIKSLIVKLQKADDKLLQISNMIQPDPKEIDDLQSHFGVSTKLDLARDKLKGAKQKHINLRKEWYCQEDHLNKLAKEVEDKEKELKLQSIFCTIQGLILSKLLWKASKLDSMLDVMVVNDKLVMELIKTLDGCLYAFTQTFTDEMPEPSAEEYQYVLSLCGILSNLATIPDGRFLLVHENVSREVYNQIITILPNILVPKADDLKWIMLAGIYNLMLCKEGKNYAKSNKCLLKNLGECITPPHSNKITILALKIISYLTDEIPNKDYMDHVSSFLPVKRLEELQKSKESVTIRKQAKQILSSVMHFSELLISTAELNESQPRLRCEKPCKMNKQEFLSYYVFTDGSHGARKKYSSSSYSSSSSTSSSSESSTEENSSKSHISETPEKLPRSNPISFHGRGFVERKPSPISDYSSTDLEGTATVSQDFSNGTVKSFKYDSSFSFRPSEASSNVASLSEASSHGPDPTASISEEIQNIQYQIPQVSLNQIFSTTIGDHIQNARVNQRHASNNTYPDGHNNGSILTVFRISNSKALLSSDNSLFPFCSNISTSTSFPLDAAMEGFLAIKTKGIGTSKIPINKVTLKETATAETETADLFDVASGGYGSCITDPTKSVKLTHDNLPSTSTGCYGYDFLHQGVLSSKAKSSSSSSLLQPEKETRVKIAETPVELEECKKPSETKWDRKVDKCKPTKGCNESSLREKKKKRNKAPFYRIFWRRRKF